ncbi:DNA transposase THAP9 [Eudromia elegans]
MTRSCSALGCTARDNGRSRERGISFHQFPVDAAQRRAWIRAVNRVDPRSRQAWRPGPGAILCSRHFAEGDFESYGLRRKLRRGAVPSRFPPRPDALGTRTGSGLSPRARKQPLLIPADDEVIADDHNYSLKEAAAAAGQQAQAQALGAWPGEQQPVAVWRSPAPGPRNLLRVIRGLVEKKWLPEESVRLLQAQFPGFSNDIFIRLQEKVEKGDQPYRYCALLAQDMALQRQQEWDAQSQHLMGFVDVGAGVLDADEAPLASDVIILMAVGIMSPWRAPLGYFFVHSLSGHLLAQLLRQAINKLNNIGVAVLSVTAGATAHGAETARALGIRVDLERLQCTFQHPPGSAHYITFFFDMCHVLQLIRNALQCLWKIQWLGEAAEWQHVVDLAALQEKRVLEVCNSSSGCSGKEQRCYLKVNLATQLFSEGVADALEHLQNLGLPSFQNCSGTIKFVRLMSHLCNVFQGRSPSGRGQKGPLLAGNYSKISHLFSEARSFLLTLTDSVGRCIIKSKRKLGFLSLLLNAESLTWLYANYVLPQGQPLQCLLPRAFSLKQLELFLHTLCQACAGHGHPTCTAFKAAYGKLLSGCSLAPGPHGSGFGDVNPLDLPTFCGTDLTLGKVRSQYDPTPGKTLALEDLSSAGLFVCDLALSNALTDPLLHKQSVARTAGVVAEHLASNLHCDACVAALFESEASMLRSGAVLYIKKSGGVSLPSASVHHITSVSERVLRTYAQGGGGHKNSELWDLFLQKKIFSELLGQRLLFPTLTDHFFDRESSLDNHYVILVKKISLRVSKPLDLRFGLSAKYIALQNYSAEA